MSDDFIPLNQSTPVQRQWNQGRNQNLSSSGGFRDNHFQNGKRGRRAMRQGNKWGNNTRNSSFSVSIAWCYVKNGKLQMQQTCSIYLYIVLFNGPDQFHQL